MESCLYEGWVWHTRRAPIKHRFRYRVSYLLLDLDELDDVFADRWLWSTTRRAIVRFHRADHFGSPQVSLRDSVNELLKQRGCEPATGPIRLLTLPRYFGFRMNPVAFFFCFDTQNNLQTVVAEVTNTPWRERHVYVLPARGEGAIADKAFHVSPFMGMDMQYRWRLEAPSERLQLRIENLEQGQRMFSAAMRLERRPISTANLARALWRYPAMTQRVATAIYWQAFLLWSKGCRYYPHPKNSRLELSPSAALHPPAALPPPPACVPK